jgi:hypothetical protein
MISMRLMVPAYHEVAEKIAPNIELRPLGVRKSHGLQGRTRVWAQPESGHMGPPPQKIHACMSATWYKLL